MFDPTLPVANSPNSSAQMRAQLQSIVDLISSIPVGPPGQNGSDGTSVTGAVIDGTNTLNPGDAAQASVSWDGANVRFTFGIPRGQDGVSGPPITSFIVDGVSTLNPGEPATVQTSFNGASVGFLFGIPRGNDGNAGNDGGPGPQGPPFAQALVDAVNTLDPGQQATVSVSFDGTNVRFTFGIPRGQNGNDGGTGPQGAPGEVTSAQLNSAISGTSSNTNVVATLDTPFANDPPTLADLELMRAKMNELITALRR